MIIIWIAAGFLIYYLLKNDNNINIKSKSKDAEEVLKERYVKGEIDDETFNKMMKIIKQ